MMEGTDACEKGLMGQEYQSESNVPLLSAENIDDLHPVPLDSEPPQCQDGPVVVCPRCGRVRTLERPPPPEARSTRHYRRLKNCCLLLFYIFIGLTILFAWLVFIYIIYEKFQYRSDTQDIPRKLNDHEDFLHQIQRLGSRL